MFGFYLGCCFSMLVVVLANFFDSVWVIVFLYDFFFYVVSAFISVDGCLQVIASVWLLVFL